MNKQKWIALGLSLAGTGSAFVLRNYVYRKAIRRLVMLNRFLSEKTPKEAGLPFEEVWFKSRDGLKLHGWFIPAQDSLAGKATIIMGHGHSGSKVADLHYAAFFRQGGYSVFMLDFRGHGQSEGPKGTSMGYWERYDIAGVVDWLLGRGLTRFGIFGISMGAAIAILAAAENPLIKAVVADSAYAHLPRAISHEIQRSYGLPVWLAQPLGWWAYAMVAKHHGFSFWEGHSAEVVAKIAPRPLLIIHAEEDNVTPVENAQILFQRALHPKELWIQPGIGHVEGYNKFGVRYEQRVLEFLDRVNWQATTAPLPSQPTLDGK
ncbi:MAG: alpha/beta fold hydrolase [Chloroflexota bacterium]|nr:alpha/beta fold hydrolase [Chloroflexota bacterium]